MIPSYDIMFNAILMQSCVCIFQKLAIEAEANIENTDPPLFLRFINLLVNDAIYLLDEALDVSSINISYTENQI